MKIKKLLLPLISCISLSGCPIVNDLLDNIFSPGGGASGGQNSTSNNVTFKDYLDVVELETLDSKIKQQEQLFNSGYGSEKDLLQAKIDRTTAEIELEQNKLSLAGAYYTAKFICSQE